MRLLGNTNKPQLVPAPVVHRFLLLGIRNAAGSSKPSFFRYIQYTPLAILQLSNQRWVQSVASWCQRWLCMLSWRKTPRKVLWERLCSVQTTGWNDDSVHLIDLFSTLVSWEHIVTTTNLICTTYRKKTTFILWRWCPFRRHRYRPRIYGYPCSAHDRHHELMQLENKSAPTRRFGR